MANVQTDPHSAAPKTRVVGSNYTTFNWRGQSIAYCEGVVDSGQALLGGTGGAGYDVIQPLGNDHPLEIATGRVVGAGTLTLVIRELWRMNVWEQLAGLAGTRNILGVLNRLASMGSPAYCTRIITSPDGYTRGDTFHNVTVTAIPDGDQITLDALTVARQITAVYTHKTPLA